MARILLLLGLICLASAAATQERPQGLLWNRSGMAATLPLQVKTDAGRDYLLHLRDVDTGRAVLAAYIRGGAFFRVLAPPGTFEVVFYSGEIWGGEAALFGPETRRIMVDRPLTFAATISRRNGHLIDLRKGADTVVEDFAICQRLALDPDSLRRPDETARADGDGLRSRSPDFVRRRYDVRSRVCD